MGTFGGGFDVSATDVSDGADRRHARGARSSARRDPAGLPRRLEPVVPAGQGAPARHARAKAGGLPRRGARPRPSSRTRPTGSRPGRRGTARTLRSGSALETRPGLAVVDPLVVPRRSNFNFGGAARSSSFSGFYVEDKSFTPVRVDVRDPQTGRHVTLTVIGVLSDTAPLEMAGISTSQRTLARVVRRPGPPDRVPVRAPAGVDADATATGARVGVPRQRHAGRLAHDAAGRRGRRAR